MWSKCTAKLGAPPTPLFPSLWGIDVTRLLDELSEFVEAAIIEDWGLIATNIQIHSMAE